MKNPVPVYLMALQDLLQEDLEFYQFVKCLKSLKPLFQKEVLSFFLSYRIDSHLKKKVLTKIFHNPTYKEMFLINGQDLVLNFFCVLLDRGHFSWWEDILLGLISIEQERRGVMVVQVESVKTLTDAIRQGLRKSLETFFKKSIELEEHISPHLLGGLRLSAGGVVFNDSLLFHAQCLNNYVQNTSEILLSGLSSSTK